MALISDDDLATCEVVFANFFTTRITPRSAADLHERIVLALDPDDGAYSDKPEDDRRRRDSIARAFVIAKGLRPDAYEEIQRTLPDPMGVRKVTP